MDKKFVVIKQSGVPCTTMLKRSPGKHVLTLLEPWPASNGNREPTASISYARGGAVLKPGPEIDVLEINATRPYELYSDCPIIYL